MSPTRRLPRAAATCSAVLLALAACGGEPPSPAAGPDAATPAGTAAPPVPPSLAPGAPSGTPAPSPAAQREVDASAPQVLVTGLQVPWGLAFLPGGDALVTERDTARLLRIPAGGGTPVEVTRFDDVDDTGEGGLMGLATSPSFAQDNLVYAYYTGPEDNRVVRFRLDQPQSREPVVTGIPKSVVHNGGRIAFGPDGNLYIGTGDGSEPSRAQEDSSLGGKVLRTTPDGRPVEGGSLVLSKGHRNVQGLGFDDGGRLYAVEFGQNSFDEVNQVRQGTNGGWPEVEGPGDGGGRFLRPITVWEPEEASPSGGVVVGSDLWVAALRGERLWRVPLDGRGGAGEPQPLLQEQFGRLRTVTTAPDGSLWVLTSNRDGRGDPVAEDDRVLRLPLR